MTSEGHGNRPYSHEQGLDGREYHRDAAGPGEVTSVSSRSKCGTYAGWNVHQKAGETPCAACRRASADYAREYRKRADVREREALDKAARERAMRALAKVHRAEYLRLKRTYLSELMSAKGGAS